MERVLLAGLSFVGVVVLVQVLLRAAPGDAADLIARTPAQRQQLVAAWSLDAPLPVAVARSMTGQLGESLVVHPGTPVTTVLAEQGPPSLRLLGLAFLLLPALALGLGLLEHSAARHPTLARPWRLLRGLGALPSYVLAFLLITGLNELTFAAMQRGWIDRPGWFSLPDTASLLRDGLAVAVLVWGGGRLASTVAEVRHRMRVLDRSPALDALRARGLPTGPAVAAGVMPVLIALPGQRSAAVLGALVVVEKLFLRPGAGATFWDAVVARDLPLAVGLAVVGAGLAVGLRLLGELGVLWAEPRARVGS